MLGLVSFFTDFSTEMVLGVLPLFIVNNLGASRAILGVIEGSAELTSYAFRMVSGAISDKIKKRKVFVLIGYGLSTVSKPLFFIATAWFDAFMVRMVDRIGKGVRTAPRDALIADSVTESISGKAFGVHRTIDQIGAIVGPLSAFAILQVMGTKAVFLFSLIPGSIAVIILIFFVKEVSIKKLLSSPKPVTIIGNIKDLLKNNKSFDILLVVTGVFSLGAFNFSFILLKDSDLGISQNTIPIVYAAINITHTIIGIPAGLLADKIGKEKVLIIGYSIFALSSILMALFSGNSYLYAYFLALVFGLYVGISETVQRAVIPKYVPADLRGTGYGLYNLVTGICLFTSNIAFGYLWDVYSVNIAVAYSLIFSVCAIGGMVVFVKRCPFYPKTV
jgi:MFS family permease